MPPRRVFRQVFNTDDPAFGGSGVGNDKPVYVSGKPSHGKDNSIAIRIPPFGAVFLEGRGRFRKPPLRRKTSEKGRKK